MKHRRVSPLAIIALAFALPALQGCAGMLVGGTAAAGVAIAEERSVGNIIDDTTIKIQVNELLFRTDYDLFAAVGIDVFEGQVLMTGSVERREDRVEAVRLAWQVPGVKKVTNEIQVSDKGGLANYLRDAWISTQLRSKLLFDKEIAAINYNVETVNGVVYLIGIAQNEVELERVTNHARTLRHVNKVVSHVRLKNARAG